MPELRKDPIVGRWVVIATERVRRPADFPRHPLVRRGGPCAFCPGHEGETPPEVLAYRDEPGRPDMPGWRVRVVPSKFPALRIEGDLERRGEGIYDLMNGIGAHEVVIESPDHDGELGRLPLPALEEVLRAYRDRVTDLKRDARVRSVVVFKNRGPEAGATMEHPHSQLLATPVVPHVLADELHHSHGYHDYRERCMFCDILRQETEAGARVVVATPGAVAFVPFAARVPFETWILPRRHAAAFERTGDAELREVAVALGAVLGKLDRALGDPPYNLVLHGAPSDVGDSPSFHWHFEILPRLGGLAAFELGSAFYVNPVPPEDAGRLLRDTPVD
jgi:UDPglucose--hexose-1-phosphate uridylyltransferase